MKKITILYLVCALLLVGCNTNNEPATLNNNTGENNIITSDSIKEQENNNEIITLCDGVPFNNTPSITYISDMTFPEIPENVELKKYEIQYMNYNGNTKLPYASTGKIKKDINPDGKECFLVENVGSIAVSSNVKSIPVNLNHIENIPEEIFSLNPILKDNYNTFKLYSIQLQSNGTINYILEACLTTKDEEIDEEYSSSGELIVLGNEYHHLATLLTSNYGGNLISNIQIANIDFDENLEIIVFGNYTSGGHDVSVFDFINDKTLKGSTLAEEGNQ